jgi:hypothetical protein
MNRLAGGSRVVTESEQVLASSSSILLVDWPSRDVPDTLARAGLAVAARGGPGSATYTIYEARDGGVETRRDDKPTRPIDLVYVHRPLDELARNVEMAKQIGARTVWYQSGLASSGERDPRGCWLSEAQSAEARSIVEAAHLQYVQEPYIVDAARNRGALR